LDAHAAGDVEPTGATGDDPHAGSVHEEVWLGGRQLLYGQNSGPVPAPQTSPGSGRAVAGLVDKYPTGTISITWDNADTHFNDEIEAIVRAAAERLVLLYVPPYRPWLNPLERLWRQFRREVTHGELFVSLDALLKAAHAFVDHYTQYSHGGNCSGGRAFR
jgi:hypothetical protein